MKIAFIVENFPECPSFIINQISGLIQLGHQVEVFANNEKFGETRLADVKKFQLSRHCHFFSIPRSKFRRVINAFFIFSHQPWKFQRCLLATLNFFRFGVDALRLNVFYYLLPFLGQRFDVLHAHFGPSGLLGVTLKKLGVSGKLITTFYGFDLSQFITQKGHGIYMELFGISSRLLPICDYFGNRLRQLGCPESKILVHHIGIDLARFAFTYHESDSKENYFLLSVARLIEKKGLDISLRAFARIHHAFTDLYYVIAGDGPLETELKALAQGLGIAHKVRFLGAISQDEEVEWLKRAQIFVLTSRTASDGDEEGTPTVLLEAQAVGLPVVSTQHSGIPEVVQDGKTGFLVPEGDVSATADRLKELLQDQPLRSQMAENGRKFMEKFFEIHAQSEKQVELYLQTQSLDKEN